MIKSLTRHDYERVMEIWESAVRATHHFLKEEDILYYKELIYNKYLDSVDLYGHIRQDGILTGFIGISGQAIQMLFIDATKRGIGIGKKLVQYALDEKDARTVDVNEQNQQAVGFYKHMGFVVVGRTAVDDAGKPYPILSMEWGNV
ncbi:MULTISPECIES: acetyltransferase [Olivibacter]|jgi:putative acetyltransferase|uniref:Acetyltransferase n=2 Tax=Olivibacter TaxID=376469 RepID=A0ABV6HK20_9SPHI|nr:MULTISPECIES: acetyltransferase [Olivibacter]MCL4639980.1 acetyltransferase [Olivibacter sp. UJ_SKK_5.1]MDM8175247.1 acetyltransferase [Olivibacter sp. 47]MDX3913074.1 acetyltransferase [Pseudosphingobacterium sp.]QEL02015.1 acetyltransferase [Olivibacter sp. LS-1]